MYIPSGLMTSMVTSFDVHGNIDEEGIKQNIAFQHSVGVKTIVILGGTGEPIGMTRFERERVMDISLSSAHDAVNVVSSALVGSPEEVAADILLAADYGAKACMISPPPFVRPSEDDVYRYVTKLALMSKIPLIIFNVPSRVGFLMSASLIDRLAKDIDLLVGIKESSGNLALFSEIRQRTRDTFACLQGGDALYLPSLALGGNGAILASAAAFPEYLLRIEKAMAGSNLQEARRWHELLAPFVRLLYEASHPAPLKLAIESRGYKAGKTRPPLYGISDSLHRRVEESVAMLLDTL